MQMSISKGDNLHEMPNLFSWKNKKKYFKMLSAEILTNMFSVKQYIIVKIIL